MRGVVSPGCHRAFQMSRDGQKSSKLKLWVLCALHRARLAQQLQLPWRSCSGAGSDPAALHPLPGAIEQGVLVLVSRGSR